MEFVSHNMHETVLTLLNSFPKEKVEQKYVFYF